MAVLQRSKSTIFGLVTDLAQLQSNINAEATARSAADTTLQNNIDAEATARGAADTTLQNNINAEATARSDADTALGGRVDDVNTAAGLVGDAYVAPTGTTYLGAATSLANADVKLDAAAKAIADDLAAESTRAQAAEQANATAISNEASARASADTTLQNNIDAEATARAAGDTAARSYADGILAAFVAGDFQTLEDLVAVINSDSTVEGSFRKAIADVIDSAPEALNTLSEIAAYINVNGTGDDVLTAITNSITAAKAEIRGEVTAAYDTLGEVEDALNVINGSSTTEGSIAKVAADAAAATSAEAAARASADTTLQNNIDAEATARAGADTTLQSNITAEATARANADTALQSNIDAEASARAAADTTLQNNIDAEATARASGDTTLTNALADLSGVTDAATARTNLNVYSKPEVDAALLLGGARFITEILTVSADSITLTHEPKDGVIFNFGTVRHTDANFVSYDIPATVGGSAKVYNLSPNASGDFDGKAVVVQYAYTPTA